MNPDINKFLEDILISIDIIEFHLKEIKSIMEYSNNITVSDAVERRFGIIGEALWKANKIEPSISVTDKIKIINFRHLLIHEYDQIDDSTIYRIAKEKLSVLKEEIKKLLQT